MEVLVVSISAMVLGLGCLALDFGLFVMPEGASGNFRIGAQ